MTKAIQLDGLFLCIMPTGNTAREGVACYSVGFRGNRKLRLNIKKAVLRQLLYCEVYASQSEYFFDNILMRLTEMRNAPS